MYWKKLFVIMLLLLTSLSHLTPTTCAAPIFEPNSSPSTNQSNIDNSAPQVAEDYAYKFFLPFVGGGRRQLTAYYISTNGVDSSGCSGGTQANPWKTWAKAETCVAPGDIVYFMAGTYANVFTGSDQNKITFAGAPGNPIQIKPAPGAEGQVRFTIALSIWGHDGVVSGIDIDATNAYSAILIYESKNITIENCKLHDTRVQDCVHIHKHADSISLINNEVYNCGYTNTSYSGPGDAVDVTGGTNIVYRGNHVHHAMRGFQVKGGSLNVLVENNRIHDVDGVFNGEVMGAINSDTPEIGNLAMHDPALAIEDRYQTKNITIRNNLIYNVSGYAAMLFGGWVDYHIYNNTILNQSSSQAFAIQSGTWEFFDSTALAYCATHNCDACSAYTGPLSCVKVSLPSKNGEIKNNIFYAFDQILKIWTGGGTTFEIANNLYYTPGLTNDTPDRYKYNGTWYSFAQFQTLGHEAGSLIADPRFMDLTEAANPNLKLHSTSPAIDRGSVIPSVTRDFEGSPRPQGASYDIGAYEFNLQ